MSDFSLTLVLQIKTSKIINDMAKVSIKSEKITAFGGIFSVSDIFDRILSSVIDSHLGLRSKLIGYQSARLYGLQTSTNTSSRCRSCASSGWKQRTGSRASCSDSSPCRPSGLGLQGKMHSTSTLASHTTSSGLTDRKNTFVGHSSRQSDFGERGDCAPKCDVL